MTARIAATSAETEGDRLPPVRFALEPHTWKEIAHLLANLPMALFGFVYVVTVVSVGSGLAITVIGLPVLALGLMGARLLGRFERARARALLGVRVDEPSPLPRGDSRGAHGQKLGFLGRLMLAVKDPVGWRTILYDLIRLPWGVFTFSVVLMSLFVLWPVLPFLARGLTNVDRVMVRGLLSPSDELERRIAELESDRGVVVDTAAADLRRIERDLHDGAQARLVNLAMGLGLAKEKLLEGQADDVVAAMVEEAHGEVKLALQELRDLARGIHPAVLTDRGLDAALSSVASRCTVPVKVTADLLYQACRRHRGHRLLHGLRAAPEHQQAQRGAERLGRGLAHREPAADPGLGRRTRRCAARRRYGDGGARGPAGRGGRAVRHRLAGGRPHDRHGRTALAGTDRGVGAEPQYLGADTRVQVGKTPGEDAYVLHGPSGSVRAG